MPENAPTLSVVIAAHNGLPELTTCLTSLQNQQVSADVALRVEIIVAGCFSEATASYLQQTYAAVRWLRAARPVSVPHLRSWGMREATGAIVALLEDHCAPARNWYHAMLAAHETGQLVVGGAVENGSTARLKDWAVYLFEYSPYMNPVLCGAASQLPGNNVSYHRKALYFLEKLLRQDLWEAAWHEQLAQEGIGLYSQPDIVVYHHKSFAIQGFWRLARRHAHNYAATRTFSSPERKWLWMLGAPLLPLLMVLRIGRRVAQKRNHVKEFLLASPLILWFAVGWTLGEITGTLSPYPKPEAGWGEAPL